MGHNHKPALYSEMIMKRTWVIALLVIGCVTASVLVAPEPTKSAPARPYYASILHDPLVIAHQGGDGLTPGNTLAAFQNAADLGADVIETDVHMTKDGVMVLMHDGRVDYTTDGSGSIEDMNFVELEKLDAAYKWSPDHGETFPFRGQNITVPTLAEAFRTFPDKRFVLDVKLTRAHLETQLCDLIRQNHMQDRVVVASLYDAIVSRFRQACPEVATAASFGEFSDFVIFEHSYFSKWMSPDYASLEGPFDPTGMYGDFVLTSDYVQRAHAMNVKVEPLTNDPSLMRHYVDVGVDGIITDRPDFLLKILNR